MIHKFSKYDIDDIEQEAERYPVTEERIEHGRKFWKIMGYGFGAVLCVVAWCFLIYWTFVRK